MTKVKIELVPEEVSALNSIIRETLEGRAYDLYTYPTNHPEDIEWKAQDIYMLSNILSKIHASVQKKGKNNAKG